MEIALEVEAFHHDVMENILKSMKINLYNINRAGAGGNVEISSDMQYVMYCVVTVDCGV